jgi:hypothetical protein
MEEQGWDTQQINPLQNSLKALDRFAVIVTAPDRSKEGQSPAPPTIDPPERRPHAYCTQFILLICGFEI